MLASKAMSFLVGAACGIAGLLWLVKALCEKVRYGPAFDPTEIPFAFLSSRVWNVKDPVGVVTA